MTQNDLINSANKLRFSTSTIDCYKEHQPILIAKLNTIIFSLHEDYLIQHKALLITNHENHSKFIGSLIELFSGKVLVETFIWATRTYIASGIPEDYWILQFRTMKHILQSSLPVKCASEMISLYA